MKMMVNMILSVLLLSACNTPHQSVESTSGKQAQQNSDKTEQQITSEQTIPKTEKSAQQELSVAVINYENASLKTSEKKLLNTLHSNFLSKHDQVIAHKYLAFIYCTSQRKRQCRTEFRKALKIDPAFDLTPAEAGHPLWGPVFHAEKAKHENQ